MNKSEKEYLEARRQRSDRFKQIFVLLSILSFGGSLVFGTLQIFTSAAKPPSETAREAVQSVESQLAEQARGYELVLQREPDNQTALEGLANVRLQMNDGKGAIAVLEKLVKQHPDREDYKTVLAEVKKRISQTSDRSR